MICKGQKISLAHEVCVFDENAKGMSKDEAKKEAFEMFVKPLLEKVDENSLSALRILQCEMELVKDEEHQAKIDAAEAVISKVNITRKFYKY